MALTFTAPSQYIALNSTSGSLANVGGATLMAWIKPTSIEVGTTNVFTLSTGDNVSNSRARLGLYNAGGDTVSGRAVGGGRIADSDTYYDQTGTAGSVTVAAGWQHICAIFDYPNKVIRVYLNGTLNATSGTLGWAGTSPTSNTNSTVAIAAHSDHTTDLFFNGIIEDVRCYRRVLSANEILTVYSSRGCDNIVFGLDHKYLLNEGSEGVAL
jgi:hypothetical protein